LPNFKTQIAEDGSAHLRKVVVKWVQELKKEAKTAMGEADEVRKERLKVLDKDCNELEALVRKLLMDLAERFEAIHRRYLFASPSRRGEQADLWYRMRLFSNRLWSRSEERKREIS